MGSNLSRIAISALALCVFADSHAAPSSCPDSYLRMLKESASKYWKGELRPLLDLANSKSPGAGRAFNGKILSKIPEPVQKGLITSARCANASICLAEQGIKVGFAPAFLVWDTVKTPPLMLYKSAKAVGADSVSREFKKILILPASVVYKNTPYLVGYSTLAAAGYSLPHVLDDSSKTLLSELDQAMPQGEPLKQDELLVFVHPAGASELSREVSQSLASQRVGKGVVSSYSQIVNITVSTPEELVRRLSELRRKGRIKELVMMAHGASGEFDFKSSGLADIVHPSKIFDSSGSFNQESLDRLKPEIRKWPADLFAANARVNLVSCKVAKGRDGKLFVSDLAGMLLQHGGTFVASPRSVSGNPSEVREKPFEVADSYGNELFGQLMYHFLKVPFDYATNLGWANIVYKGMTGEYSQDPLHVIHVDREK